MRESPQDDEIARLREELATARSENAAQGAQPPTELRMINHDSADKALGQVSLSTRGFSRVDFTDAYGEACHVACSSVIGDYDDSMDRPGTSAVWLGVTEVKPKVMAKDAPRLGVLTDETVGWVEYPVPPEVLLSGAMHLNREQVAGLIRRLQQWLEAGSFTEGKA